VSALVGATGREAADRTADGGFVHVRAEAGGVRVRGAPAARWGQPDGPGRIFAEWAWDGAGLTVRNDRYGMIPLFYWATPRQVAVSPRIADLLAAGAPADLDHDALAVFLRMGFYVGEDTPFAAIRAVPPGVRFRWSPDAFRLDSAHTLPERRDLTRAQAVDGYIELFRQAMARRAPDAAYVLPVGGGRDSRHILLELMRQGAPPRLAVTTAKFVPRDADTRVARRLAAAAEVPHRLVDRPVSQFRAELAANRAQQLCTTEGAWLLPLSRFLRGRTPLTYDGLGGDALSQSPYLHLAREQPWVHGREGELARWLLETGRRDRYLPGLLSAGQAELLGSRRAADRLAAELRRHGAAAVPLRSFYFWNRTRRAIAANTFSLLGRGGALRVHTPFLDHDLYDLLASLPFPVLGDGRFHTETILRAYPRYAHLPFADEPTRHGPRFVWDRVTYLTDLLGHVACRDRHWWRAGDGLLPRLLTARHPNVSRSRMVNRLLPFAVYLLQLDDLARGVGADPLVGSRGDGNRPRARRGPRRDGSARLRRCE
jgi:asparagine synthase (glutamine-hydrolysing)